MSRSPSPNELREAIADVLWANTKAYETERACDALGMPPAPEDADGPWSSKTVYARGRLIGCPRDQLLDIARKVADEYGGEELEQYLTGVGVTGVDGELKNLIFAADGPKPRIVLRDAVNNVIEIVENAEHCLVYDRPLGPDGLTWQLLVEWWRERHDPGAADDLQAGRRLYDRLRRSLQGTPEEILLRVYSERYGQEKGFQLPALVPQVYLHYDPYTKAELGPEGEVLSRQRMDFLILFADRSRAVIEVDGRQHYASGANLEKPDPDRYTEMVREDRALRLRGYEVYRFSASEVAREDAPNVLNTFFDTLLNRHA
jgi:very-short-patch-repair endonuclease